MAWEVGTLGWGGAGVPLDDCIAEVSSGIISFGGPLPPFPPIILCFVLATNFVF